ncbi:FHA domain-containing protein [Jannaschia sp. LMIT008]|uniref:FHA domain-containing protein n=1 Tax=Jannaschia maritima TaxID=3032585 RepID=UPI0028118246|nr:FHA domain-containing protein [Jannaschia sp. LMIT008]
MGVFSALFGGRARKRRRIAAFEEGRAAFASRPGDGGAAPPFSRFPAPVRDAAAPGTGDATPEAAPRRDIWDMEPPAEAEDPPEGPGDDTEPPSDHDPLPTARTRRSRTRLIGFDGAVDESGDPFAAAPVLGGAGAAARFPVGWLVVRDGPGRGHAFALQAGMAQIGRGPDQAVQLDFGDTAISRSNHAAVVYDPASRAFLLGHGGHANIVRLNGAPVLSNETMADGDLIAIGETVLMLRTLCGPNFDWSEAPAEGREDVAIV